MAKLTVDVLKNSTPEPGKRLELRDDDEPGLVLRVTDKGKRSWSIRYVNGAGEHRRQLIGPFPAISLSKAREEARKIKGAVAAGTDLVQNARDQKTELRAKRLRTLAGLAEAYFEVCEQGLHRASAGAPKRASTLTLEKSVFERLIKPTFGETPVVDIKRADIQALVNKKTKLAVSNGRYVRNLLRQLLNYALQLDMIEANSAYGVAVVLPAARERVLSDNELRAVWAACEDPTSVNGPSLTREMGLLLQMAIVTLQRGGEVAGMKWSEIDVDRRIWTIPASRMKGKRTHVVPLSQRAMDILQTAKLLIGGRTFVFQSDRTVVDPKGNEVHFHFDRRALTRAMKRLTRSLKIENATPHDLRRTGATNITSERIGIPRFIVSQVLAHAGDTCGSAAVTGRHYDLNDYLVEKRRALDAWAALLQSIVTGQGRAPNVVSLTA